MGQLLLHSPVHVPEVGVAHRARLVRTGRLDGDLQLYVESVLVLVFKIRERGGVLKNDENKAN